jgi:hypothetical protein
MIDSDLIWKALSVLLAAGSGGKLLADVSQPLRTRSVAVRSAQRFCHEARSFASLRFRLASFLVLGSVFILALLLTVSAICAALLLVAFAWQWPTLQASVAKLTVPNMVVYAAVSFALYLIGYVILTLEPSMSLRKTSWLFGVAEQTLADRIRRGDEGVFRVDDDRCERLAESIHTKLRDEPTYISDALLEPHGDRARLANELVVGGLLEGVASQVHRGFGGAWEAYRPIQNHVWNGRPVLAAESIRQAEPRQLAAAINAFFTDRGLALSLTVEGLLEDLLRRLRDQWHGNASRLFSFPSPPWKDLVYGCAVSAALYGISAGMFGVFGIKPWPFATGHYLAMTGKLAVVIAALTVVLAMLTNPAPWLVWLALTLRLVTKFGVVGRRLRGLKRFGDRDGMRRAQAKFAWEFGLFKADPQYVPVGSQKALLVSLKTGALAVSGTERVSGADQDLWTFGELIIRKVGAHLRNLYRRSPIYASTDGQYDADNTVDGFLHRVGYRFCHVRACSAGAAQDQCPFREAAVCDVIRADTTQEWRYERGPNVFSLQNRPVPEAAAQQPLAGC